MTAEVKIQDDLAADGFIAFDERIFQSFRRAFECPLCLTGRCGQPENFGFDHVAPAVAEKCDDGVDG